MTDKINVTNKHDALLNVAGVDIRPGATAAVNKRDLDSWKTGYAATLWLEQELVIIGDKSGSKTKEPAKTDNGGSTTQPEGRVDRAAYLAKAKELELGLPGNVSNADLVKAVNEAEAKKASEAGGGE